MKRGAFDEAKKKMEEEIQEQRRKVQEEKQKARQLLKEELGQLDGEIQELKQQLRLYEKMIADAKKKQQHQAKKQRQQRMKMKMMMTPTTTAAATEIDQIGAGVGPVQHLSSLLTSYRISRAVQVAAQLQIADHIRDNPKSALEIARICGADPRSLFRLMRCLSSISLFTEVAVSGGDQYDAADDASSVQEHEDSQEGERDAGKSEEIIRRKEEKAEEEDEDEEDGNYSLIRTIRFANTHISRLLMEGDPSSIRKYALENATDYYGLLNGLLGSVQLGKNEDNMIDVGIFDPSDHVREKIVSSFETAEFKSIVDVGGGPSSILFLLIQSILSDLQESEEYWKNPSAEFQINLNGIILEKKNIEKLQDLYDKQPNSIQVSKTFIRIN